jgi:hypothetical protein
MKRILVVLLTCVSCGGGEGAAPSSAPARGKETAAGLQSCYVVVDDGGAVGLFAAFDPGSSPIPQRVDSITFFGQDRSTPVLTWNKGGDLKPLDEARGRRARRRADKTSPPRLRYATNVQAVDWGADTDRWPRKATVTMGGDVQPSCELGELVIGTDTSRPTRLGATNTDGTDAIGYGNCPHCLASFLCSCLELEEQLEYCEPPPPALENCPEVLDYLFPPAS